MGASAQMGNDGPSAGVRCPMRGTRRAATAAVVGTLAMVATLVIAAAPASGQTATCAGRAVTINLNAGDSGTGTLGDDVILGTPGPDVIDGRAGNDVICGGGGDDQLTGGAGNDRLFGGGGADTLEGGDGDDHLQGAGGRDILRGDKGTDRLVGGAGWDRLFGGNGRDWLEGNAGRDFLKGGLGSDTIYGGSHIDTIRGGPGDDVIFGNGGDDKIKGENGNDTIEGGYGNDRIEGGNGVDDCTGAVANTIGCRAPGGAELAPGDLIAIRAALPGVDEVDSDWEPRVVGSASTACSTAVDHVAKDSVTYIGSHSGIRILIVSYTTERDAIARGRAILDGITDTCGATEDTTPGTIESGSRDGLLLGRLDVNSSRQESHVAVYNQDRFTVAFNGFVTPGRGDSRAITDEYIDRVLFILSGVRSGLIDPGSGGGGSAADPVLERDCVDETHTMQFMRTALLPTNIKEAVLAFPRHREWFVCPAVVANSIGPGFSDSPARCYPAKTRTLHTALNETTIYGDRPFAGLLDTADAVLCGRN